MSVIVHAVQASLSPSPSASPVVQAAVQAHAAAATVAPTSFSDLLNKVAALLSPYVVFIGAALASSAQALLNKLPWLQSDVAKLQDLYRRLLAVALPLLGTFLAGLATGQNTLQLAPWIFLVSQVLYTAVKALQATGAPSTPAAALAVEEPAAG